MEKDRIAKELGILTLAIFLVVSFICLVVFLLEGASLGEALKGLAICWGVLLTVTVVSAVRLFFGIVSGQVSLSGPSSSSSSSSSSSYDAGRVIDPAREAFRSRHSYSSSQVGHKHPDGYWDHELGRKVQPEEYESVVYIEKHNKRIDEKKNR